MKIERRNTIPFGDMSNVAKRSCDYIITTPGIYFYPTEGILKNTEELGGKRH